MSRIDEALRRAAAQHTASGAEHVPAPVAAADIDLLAQEPFPSASGPDQVLRTLPGVQASAAPDGESSAPVDGAEPAGGRRHSLFGRIDARLAEKVVVDGNMDAASREQYRRLAAALHDAQAHSGVRVVMIASAVAGEGKTLTAANLALTLSESYHRRVLLIDADLRKPALHNVFKINTVTGLSEGLHADAPPKLVLRQLSLRLSLLPAGRPNSDPMAGLTSERMRMLVAEARETFDWVIIDTPPIVLLPDANLLAAMADGAVLVVRANSTPHHLVKRAVDAIGPRRILGAVLNQAQTQDLPYGRYYHAYYSHEAVGAGEG